MLVVLAEGGQVLQPLINVLNQSALIVVHVHAGRDVHGGNQHHTFFHSALAHNVFHLRRHMHIRAMRLGMKLQIFGKNFHFTTPRDGTSARFYPSDRPHFWTMTSVPHFSRGSQKTTPSCLILDLSRRFLCCSGLITYPAFLRLCRPSCWASVAGRAGFWRPSIAP